MNQKKKKQLTFGILLLVVLVLGFFATDLVQGKGKSNRTLDDFMVLDTASVDRIIISTSYGDKMDLVRTTAGWTTSTGQCVQKEPLQNILHTLNKASVKSYLPNSSVENIKNQLSIDYRKVEIFQNGKWTKTWYVGNSTADHYGTYVLLETAQDGKSNAPVVLEMKGLKGTIEPRFFADPRMWACTQIFAYNPDEIASIKLENFEQPMHNFEWKRKNNQFILYNGSTKEPVYDTLRLVRFLEKFRKVHFESPNFKLNAAQVDSLKKSKPYHKLSVSDKKGVKKSITTHRMAAEGLKIGLNGDTLKWDENKLWAFLDDGELVQIQYFVFDEILVHRSYFTHQEPTPTGSIP
jgi:hypothetical protein